MANRRTAYSLNKFRTLLFWIAGTAALFLTFIAGVMIGRETKGITIFDREVKSDVIKMKIESTPLDQPPVKTAVIDEKTAIMKNVTTKPVITFYDTLAKQSKNAKATSSNDTLNKTRMAKPSKMVYTIQVGAMKDRSLADNMVSKLKKKGYSANIVSSESSGKATWYKVRMGTFSNREDARKEAARIGKNEGISTTVVEK